VLFRSLGMCGHGTIGLAITLAHLGKIAPGPHRLETPVGTVGFDYEGGPWATVVNVPSYRHAKAVTVDVPGIGKFTGDVAWGGNWFFLVENHGQELSRANIDRLTDVTWRIRQALTQNGITGANGQEIDHVELFGPASSPSLRSKNFVLCPGRAYDRSPCGTGTSAKLACLVADSKLREGQAWRQESIIGSVFEGKVRIVGDKIVPYITGTAYVTGEATLLLDPADPLQNGIRT
jgi:4-hydroxyproline epimerase